MRNASGNINPATGGWTFNPMGNGAGGWCTRLDVANDGYEVVGTDTIGPLIRGPSATKWISLLNPGVNVTAAEMDAVATAGWGDDATYDVAIAKTNSSVLYFAQHGFVWKSTDRGGTVTRTARAYDANLFASAAGGSGGSVRMSGKRLVIDPAGTAVIALGHQVDGLYYSLDSGATWTKNTGIPAPTGSAKNVFVAFDTTSTTSGTPLRYQTVYVYSAGNGVYKSTTGIDGTFSLMTSSPTAASVLICAGGKPFIAGAGGNSPATVQFYNGTAWTSSGISAQTLCFNPADTTKMWALSEGGNVYYSSNSGASFTSVTSSLSRAATDIPWLAWCNEAYMSNGDVIYNPNTNLLTFAEGIGVWSMTPPTAAGALTWTSKSLGINNLVAQHIRVTSAGRVITSSQDRAFFAFSRTGAGVQALTHGVANGPFSINPGQTTDYAIDDPNFIVGVTGNNGVATNGGNGGAPNSYIANQPPATSTGYWGGNIVCGNKTNWILFQTSSGSQVGKVHYTLDGGVTWNPCVFNAVYDGLINWHGAYYLQRVIAVADKANPGTFYAYMVGDGSQPTADAALKGVWKTTTGGASWSRVYSSTITSADGYNGKLKMNAAGHLAWCAGPQGGDYDTPTNINIMFSNTGGTSWAAISGLIEPADYCWGKAKTGGTYQTLYAYGWVSGVRGLYRMDDFNPATASGTWTLIDRWPATLTGGHLVLEADPNAYGRVYIGNSVQGFGYGDYTDTAHGT